MVQIAWLFYVSKGKLVDSKDYIIKQEGYTISLEASRVHGISTARAKKEGSDLHDAKKDIKATAKCFWKMEKIGIVHFA